MWAKPPATCRRKHGTTQRRIGRHPHEIEIAITRTLVSRRDVPTTISRARGNQGA
jgi:hypothetical protein